MPSSGGLEGNHVADGGERVYLDWQVASQDVANNRSKINWQVGWHFITYNCRGLRLGHGVVNSSTVYNDTDSGDGVHAFNSGHNHTKLQTASGSIWVTHNSDGTKTLTASAHMTGYNGQYSSGSGSWALPTIPLISDPPNITVADVVSGTQVHIAFTDGGGGAAIDARYIRVHAAPYIEITPYSVASDGDDIVGGLDPGHEYRFSAYTHNAAGYSNDSPYATRRTFIEPYPPDPVSVTRVDQTSADVSWVQTTAPFSPDRSSQEILYNTSDTPVGGTTVVLGSEVTSTTLTGLTPNTKYYIFVRGVSSFGNGPWSSSINTTTLAGAWVNVAGVWKRAVPYVRVSGVWKVARPWVKVLGVWKEGG